MNRVKKPRDDEIERSVYFPDVANMGGIDTLESKDRTQTSYLKDDLEVFFLGYPDIFDSDLKFFFFENIAPEEKKKYLLQVTFKRNYNTV